MLSYMVRRHFVCNQAEKLKVVILDKPKVIAGSPKEWRCYAADPEDGETAMNQDRVDV